MNRNSEGALGLGVITIFTVLIVLSLTVFAVLTLASAEADLSLSRINAETVSAYYAADIEAGRLYTDFASGTSAELEEDIFMTGTQSLHLHLRREGGKVLILAWNTVPSAEPETDNAFELWDGSFSE